MTLVAAVVRRSLRSVRFKHPRHYRVNTGPFSIIVACGEKRRRKFTTTAELVTCDECNAYLRTRELLVQHGGEP